MNWRRPKKLPKATDCLDEDLLSVTLMQDNRRIVCGSQEGQMIIYKVASRHCDCVLTISTFLVCVYV